MQTLNFLTYFKSLLKGIFFTAEIILCAWASSGTLPVSKLLDFPREDNIYTCFKQFGSYKNQDLDAINHDLASREILLSTCLKTSQKRDNLVLACLNIFWKMSDGTIKNKTINIRVADVEGNLEFLIFESRINREDYPFIDYEELKEQMRKTYNLEPNLTLEPSTLYDHVRRIWGHKVNKNIGMEKWEKRPNLSEREKIIWEDFEDYQREIEQSTKTAKQALIDKTKGINKQTAKLVDKTLNVAYTEEGYNTVAKVLIECIDIFKDLEQQASNLTKIMEEQKKLYRTHQTFHRYFWHSEQRLIYCLQQNKFWDSIEDELDSNGTCIGAFLHIHSRHNFCDTCRHSLAYLASNNDGTLRNIIKEKIASESSSFFFKIVGSFRLHYVAQYRGQEVPMPYFVKNKDLNIYRHMDPKCPDLFIKREHFGGRDEKEKDEKWRLANQNMSIPFTI